MYDDDKIMAEDNAIILLIAVRNALSKGVKHFRKSDNKLLETDTEILTSLLKEGSIYLEGLEDEEENDEIL